jgi:hypothetical protein
MKVKIKVPTSLSDIKLSQYQKFLRVTKDVEDVNTINRRAVGIFCNIPDDVVKQISKTSFDEIVKDITDVLDFDKGVDFKMTFDHNEAEYGFIPNLDKITLGEQIDIDNNIRDWQKMGKVMAVMFRKVNTKIKDKYTLQQYTGNEPDLDLSMDKVLGAVFFLTNLTKDLLNCTQNFIEEEVLTNPKLETLEKNGGGIKQSMESLKEIFSDLKMYLN